MARMEAELVADLAVKEIDVLDELVDEDVVSLAESWRNGEGQGRLETGERRWWSTYSTRLLGVQRVVAVR